MRRQDDAVTPQTLPAIWASTFSAYREGAAMAALYAPDAVLWGTFATELREGRDAIAGYFAAVRRGAPRMTARAVEPSSRRMAGEMALLSGAFAADDPDGVGALTLRYTIALRRDAAGWLILAHHSSVMPPGDG